MKKLYTLMISLLIGASAYAQWPENYGGVMLQGFYWNSFDDTKWTKLNAQVDEISTYFDLIWICNSANCGSVGMGYMPVYWFNHNSNWGRERTLRTMIQNFNAKGTKVIEDVVINHKSPLGVDGSWIDFANERPMKSIGVVLTSATTMMAATPRAKAGRLQVPMIPAMTLAADAILTILLKTCRRM